MFEFSGVWITAGLIVVSLSCSSWALLPECTAKRVRTKP